MEKWQIWISSFIRKGNNVIHWIIFSIYFSSKKGYNLTNNLTDIDEIPVKQGLEFMRRQGDKDGVVGRFNITLRLLAEK